MQLPAWTGARPRGLIASLALLLGIGLTLLAGNEVRQVEQLEAEVEVERQLAFAAEEVNRRLQRYSVAATAGAGTPDAGGQVTAGAWARFAAPFRLPYGLDGVHALAYARFHDVTESSWRLTVQHLASGSAAPLALAGVDLMSLPRLPETIASAVSAREPTLSAVLSLSGSEHRFVLLLMPVFRNGVAPDDAVERRRALLGMVLLAISIDDLFQSLPNWVETDASFEIIDAPIYDHPETGIYAAGERVAGNHAHNAEVNVAGRLWRVQMMEKAGAAPVWDRTRSELTFAVGALLTLLATLGATYQLALRWRAERRALEMTQTLRDSEEKYRSVTENIDVGVLVVQDGRFRYVNPALQQIIGRDAASLIDQEFFGMVHPEDRAMVLDRHQRRLRGEVVEARYNFRVLKPHGDLVWVQLSAVPIPWQGHAATLSFLNDITQHKLADDALRQSEARYRMVIDASPIGVTILHRGELRLINPAFAALLGRPLAELPPGTKLIPLIHPGDRPLMNQMANEALGLPLGRTQRGTFRILASDGSERWVEIDSVRVEYEGRLSTLAFLRDITSRRTLEEQLEHALAERETILGASMVGIVHLSSERKVLWSNRAMHEMFRSDDDSLGLGTESTYANPEDYRRFGDGAYRRIYSGEIVETELRLRRLDGEVFWAHLTGRAISSVDPSRGSVWVISDISQRKELEDALQRLTAEQNAILQSAHIGITHTAARIHKFVNQAFADMLGFTRAELIGQSSLTHFPDEASWRALGEQAYPMMEASEGYMGEWTMMCKDGRRVPVLMSGRLINPAEPARGAIWTVMDITERKQAETEIRAALARQVELNELKGQFVAMTSHEFRTPLATILSSAELLRHYHERMPPEERQELFISIEIAVRRMRQMLDAVLMIGKADAGKLDFHPQPVDIEKVAREVADESARAYGGEAALGRLSIDSLLPQGRWQADEKLLRAILGNLLANAFKYSPAGGTVRLEMALAHDGLRFVVSDQGIGIPAEDLPRLFETFHRAQNVGTISGTGLGLAIVKRSAELHGGRVGVESNVGGGTTFMVWLPALSQAS